ncbi:MAG: hypothetical protein JWP12_1397 [Bacteroidetes bacterium]|nr:hypothetical protein [Bacteroidota bacterium]
MESTNLSFEGILAEVQKNQKSMTTSPHVALDYLNVSRRGWRVIERVNKLFDQYEVFSEPNFSNAWLYSSIEIKPKPKLSANKTMNEQEELDPTPRLSLLKAANIGTIRENHQGTGLLTVKKETKLSEAITLMLMHDYSQLPILSGIRDVDGIISWKSIGRALSLGKGCLTVNDCKDEVVILNYDEPLFNAVKFVLDKEVVLVRQKDKTISGIVTSTDIGEQFISLAEPFLIIEQIENHIRRMLDGKFTLDELRKSIDPSDKSREIKNLSDLTFGEYIKIIENPEKFEKLKLKIDRIVIIKQLEEVRKIRNDVMHFDPDGITPQGLELLRQTVNFFHTLSSTLKQKQQQ